MKQPGEIILAQTYMFPWIAESVNVVSCLNKHMREMYSDNVQAELHTKLEENDTLHLADMWPRHDDDRCDGCPMRDCEWCRSWGDTRRRNRPAWYNADSEPDSDASVESNWSGRPWWA